MYFGPIEQGLAMDALQMAYFMEQHYPDKDYSSVISLLEDRDIAMGCAGLCFRASTCQWLLLADTVEKLCFRKFEKIREEFRSVPRASISASQPL